jgi:hypothetical protein
VDKYLRIFMNDQLALGVGFRELARRAQRENEGTEAGEALARVATGIAEDVETFRSMMERLGFAPSRVKPAAAWAAERIGRLKLNGHVRGYSPLSRFWELEALSQAVNEKKLLWSSLGDLAGLRERLPEFDFDELIARAQSQRDTLEPHRERAGRESLRA